MFLSSASLRRPVAMCCLIIALTLLGMNSYRKLGLESLPEIDTPYINIVTIYPGGTPSDIETDIAKRIEDVVVSIDGLKHVTSACMENVCQTLLEFNLDVDVDVAANDVREKIDLIINDFPEGTEKPKVLKYDINAKPIINLALTGDVPVDELYDFADNTLSDRLTMIAGVAEVQLIGGAEREVHVLLDRRKLAARGLASAEVVEALGRGVRLIPSGRVRDSGVEYAVKFDSEYASLEAMEGFEVRNQEGQRCYLRDIGRVVMSTEEVRETSYINGKPCVAIKVVKKADANAVAVVEQVKAAMSKLRENLPGGMELVWVSDDGTVTQAEVNSTVMNIIQGIFLTAFILFFFLYDFRATLIVAITMPLTVVITFFAMQLVGYTLNLSTLLALGLSVGILVTNSIVVLESIMKRLERTGNVVESARLGASEVGVAVLASAGTNLVVLFPIYMMGSMVGKFFGPFALTMVLVTLASLFISFTLTPILASVLLKPKDKKKKTVLAAMETGWNRMFNWFASGFARFLRFFERHRMAALLFLGGVVLLFFHSMHMAGNLGFDFFPEPDRGEVFLKLEFPTEYDLARTTDRVKNVEERIKDVPELLHVLTTIGKVQGVVGRSSEGVYLAQLLLKFTDKTEREESIEALMAMVRTRMDGYAGCIVTVAQANMIGGQSSPIELEISGDEFPILDRLALEAQELAESIPGYQEPDTTVRIGKPEQRILPKRAVLGDLGMPATGLGYTLRANLEGLTAAVYKENARNYDVVVKLEEEEGYEQVKNFQFPGVTGHPLALAAIGELENTRAPVQIMRKDKQRMSKLFSNLDMPMKDAVDALTVKLENEMQFPPNYSYFFGGEAEMMDEAVLEFLEAAIIALVLTYLVLAAILESFRQPFIIMLTVPLGFMGIIYALYITGEDFSMFVLLGAVMLVGIVVNNAILIMDQLNQYVQQGVPRHEAMVKAASERFRPIVMITLAAILGMLPLAMTQGIGSENRNGIGIASVGGIAVSALLTLFVLPILYDFSTRGKKKVKHKKDPSQSPSQVQSE